MRRPAAVLLGVAVLERVERGGLPLTPGETLAGSHEETLEVSPLCEGLLEVRSRVDG